MPLTERRKETVDFNLHDVVGVRLLDAEESDVAAVRRQLGPVQGTPAQEPQIKIRFVDHLPAPRLRYLGLDDAGFTDDAFLVLRSKHKASARVQIPMAHVGGHCEIVCERGLPAVPLLIPIVNLTALANGALPLHAAGFVYEDRGILVTGWSKGGKTETLLGFMAQGAQYVGDEWIYLSADGRRMAGIPEPIRLWDWHLADLEQFRRQLKRSQRWQLAATRPLVGTLEALSAEGAARPRTLSRFARRLLPLLRRRQGVDVAPGRLFGPQRCLLSAPLDKVFFVVSQEADDVSVQPIKSEEVARRMVFSLMEEYDRFLSYYWKFRFAFPQAANDLVDCLQSAQEQSILRLLDGKEAYAVYHPYPVPIRRTVAAMEPLCG